jgi:hypothetical protein
MSIQERAQSHIAQLDKEVSTRFCLLFHRPPVRRQLRERPSDITISTCSLLTMLLLLAVEIPRPQQL